MTSLRLNILISELFIYILAIFYAGLLAALFSKTAVVSFDTSLSFDSPVSSVGTFLLMFILATVIFLFCLRFFNAAPFWRIVLGLALFSGIQFVFAGLMDYYLAALVALLLVAVRFAFPTVLVHNVTLFLSLLGVTGMFGLGLSPYSVAILLFILSVYDYLSVYVTKHMVAVATGMVRHQAVLGFILPFRMSAWLMPLGTVNIGRDAMVLGGGDLALPLLMIISLGRENFYQAAAVGAFVLFGVFCTHLIFFGQKKKEPMPALPILSFFTILGFCFSLFFF